MAQTAANIENKSPEAAYVCKDNIVLQDDTPTTQVPLPRTAADMVASAAHATKMTAEAAAMEARAALAHMGNVTGNVKRGK